jgi:hypothetical protein
MKKRDPKKDTGYEVKLDRYKKQIESTSHLYEIKLNGRVASYYKPYTSFQQVFRSFACAHNNFLSWKPFGNSNWNHYCFKDDKIAFRIKNLFVNQGSLDLYTQLTILRDDGQIVRMKFGEGKLKFTPVGFEEIHDENKVHEKIR